ncbi:universal stress protein [Actinopolyspora mortivallis]|uniref:universal stress protein n=1 Tax=Actinopolyspora mortivallis TaxID=33906 RepID=UPI0012ED3AD6|nr:universal stress protein [Actinopolyspora mortivallis]
MTDSATPRIVVGVDGSDSSTPAAVWAAHQAAWYSAKLCLVRAYVVPRRGVPCFPLFR